MVRPNERLWFGQMKGYGFGSATLSFARKAATSGSCVPRDPSSGGSTMDIQPIRNQRDHAKALREVERLWGARARTPEADKLEILVTLIDAYEAKHHPIDPPDPIDAIRFRMEQMGFTRKDLIDIIGSRARVSEVLNRRRPLTVAMIVRLREKLGISADVLIGPQRRAA